MLRALTWLADAPQLLCTFCPLTGAFYPGEPQIHALKCSTISHRRVKTCFQEHVCKVVLWTSVFILYIIYSHTKKWSASGSFFCGFWPHGTNGISWCLYHTGSISAILMHLSKAALNVHLLQDPLLHWQWLKGPWFRQKCHLCPPYIPFTASWSGIKEEYVLHSSSLHPGNQKFSTHPGFGEIWRQFQGRAEPPLILIFPLLSSIKPFIKLY